ncbi:MAG: hypothetical protein EAY75_04035 [Bacteroidetes bacterium]|nr:MAG: hypothetical protein EAY75_04035 [Bacteroidota bacterium]
MMPALQGAVLTFALGTKTFTAIASLKIAQFMLGHHTAAWLAKWPPCLVFKQACLSCSGKSSLCLSALYPFGKLHLR